MSSLERHGLERALVRGQRSSRSVHIHAGGDSRQQERAEVLAKQRAQQDPEKEEMKREIASLRAGMKDVTKYLRQMHVQQAPAVSFLDEMLASLAAKASTLPIVPIPQSVVDALSADEQ